MRMKKERVNGLTGTVYGNSYTETPVEAYVSGTTGSHLYLDGQGNIYIKYYGGDTVYIGRTDVTATDLNVSGALYVQGSTAMVNGKNICLQDGTNCPSELGTGNISGVYGDDIYIYNGSDNGEVTLVFNETKLNATIEARATAVGDGNNYTTNIGFNETGSTIQLNLQKTGIKNLTATFTDTDTDTWWSITGSLYLW